MKPLRFLIGGSPCTSWSIAKANRETVPSGKGWKLFENFLIARQKFNPDFFLYENNKSISGAIKEQISYELGVPLQYINSALVSAQNRERFYAHDFGDVPQPADRGIILADILDSGIAWREKSYCLTASYAGAVIHDTLKRKRKTMAAELIRIGTAESPDAKNPGAKNPGAKNRQSHDSHAGSRYRVYSPHGKSVTLMDEGGGVGAKTGLYTVPMPYNPTADDTRNAASFREQNNTVSETAETAKPKTPPKQIYEVKNGAIEIKGVNYPIKLPDGFYVIRKLTVTECERLQTLPAGYCSASGVSAAQCYKGLGNGWTAEVIIHLLSYALQNVPKDTPVTVLSMYDGIGTGRYCFDMLGYSNIKYFAYEIDNYAMTIAAHNYPDIMQCGDAFGVRERLGFLD